MRAFGLIHSPLVGPDTWEPVASELRRRGAVVAVPEVVDSPDSGRPYWQQHAAVAAAGLAGLPSSPILAAHSGAGALLPAIRQRLKEAAAAYVFVDAGLPAPGSRLDNFGNPEMAAEFRRHLSDGGRFPEWTDGELREEVPDDVWRARLLAGLRPRALDYFEEPLPDLAGWPDAPCGYLLFSPGYAAEAEKAQRAGWPVRRLEGGHFHMLVEPVAVARALLELAEVLVSDL
jgi:hypothetical protein